MYFSTCLSYLVYCPTTYVYIRIRRGAAHLFGRVIGSKDCLHFLTSHNMCLMATMAICETQCQSYVTFANPSEWPTMSQNLATTHMS